MSLQMIVLYFLSSYWLFLFNLRSSTVLSMYRFLQILFIHKFSGNMMVDSAIPITFSYFANTVLIILRERGDKAYKIPTGGLFNLVIFPHYLFEIIDLFGIALISQTLHSYCFAFGFMFYLMGRSVATRNWYMSKFENFRTGVKALVPYIF
ncbi:3-oxo-5-alpha-steroid 4-dehydrogenase 2 [Rhynchospora pubera]|uniref:3-oxo-5-alpha-steroid 4-dehydrogenase 2 n=1 Tax=Rhynchospora pubera TaxID=906938 RepID=A0AAV8BRN0_9POAL|nr:3-oxo-5-alpha-steroid 4-dehydrogenase 2 [Rhynchospora pubera]